jgi:K+-transporting ATPase A subunit
MSLQYELCKFEDSLLLPLERWGYRLARIDLQHEMSWRPDASSFVLFSSAGIAPLFLILRLQSFLPFNVKSRAPSSTPRCFQISIEARYRRRAGYFPAFTLGPILEHLMMSE